MTDTWDLVVVGGGTAGLVSAKTAARLGARVVLVERERTGGDCLWTGCVPSKALIAAAGQAAGRSRGAEGSAEPAVDFGEVMAHVRGAITAIEPHDSPESLKAEGVEVVHGDFAFAGPTSGEVDGEPLAFRQAVVCVGCAPVLPPVPGLADASPLTSDTVWDLRELPRRLVVLGGGSIGCELGQAFSRLGSDVTVVEVEARLLTTESAAAAERVTDALVADGVTVLTGSAVEEVTPGPDGHVLRLGNGREVAFDALLVAAGRTPRTDGLHLDRAGVELDQRGFVRVDRRLRTTARTVWAAGDVTGNPAFTHLAGVAGSVAAGNAVLGLRRTLDTSTVPRVTYTQPEVASVGVDPETAERQPGLTVLTRHHHDVDRAVTDGATEGLTQLVVDRRGRILGGTVVGPRAGETLGELTLAVRHGMRTRDVAGTTHAYPTYNDALWMTTVEDVRERLDGPGIRRVVRLLGRARRGWLDARARTGSGSRRPSSGPR